MELEDFHVVKENVGNSWLPNMTRFTEIVTTFLKLVLVTNTLQWLD